MFQKVIGFICLVDGDFPVINYDKLAEKKEKQQILADMQARCSVTLRNKNLACI
jgi:hypothetical protein